MGFLIPANRPARYALLAALLACCPVRAEQTPPALGSPPAEMPVDVMLKPEGVLAGRLLQPGNTTAAPDFGSLVLLVSQGRVVAETAMAPDGSFIMQNIAPGHYEVVVPASGERHTWHCRMGSEGVKPADPAQGVNSARTESLVRAQTSRAAATLAEVAAGAGIVGGLIAAPIVYGEGIRSRDIPASP